MAEAKSSRKTKIVSDVSNEDIKITEETSGPAVEDKKPKSTAKAGKRSTKALKEVEEKVAKEERKVRTAEDTETPRPKWTAKPTRSHLERRGKKFRKLAELIENDKTYSLAEGLLIATKTSPTKFDATVELHLRLNVDPRHADQNVRDTVILPAGNGKAIRVAVFVESDGITQAKAAGADIVGTDEIIKLLDKAQLDFDVLIAPPTLMPKLGKYARILGPKGLMPNPKSGTVTTDITKAVSEAKAGRVEYRVDSNGIIHLGIGKVSFGADKLAQNAETVLSSIKSNKPASVKSGYIKSTYISTTMGPSVSIVNE